MGQQNNVAPAPLQQYSISGLPINEATNIMYQGRGSAPPPQISATLLQSSKKIANVVKAISGLFAPNDIIPLQQQRTSRRRTSNTQGKSLHPLPSPSSPFLPPSLHLSTPHHHPKSSLAMSLSSPPA
eukprot:TRINITY_DN7227_c0_g1_i4.p2 TRINITY_DN7227_c0_g1~~TRINITY_DN7227_c0_g1_i4.p2  ORF type:complete len:127 (+),score=12.33 TRINITY_DN7227_c0_g1_i4:486-866(+)